MKIATDAEIHFYEQDTASVFLESFTYGDIEKAEEIALLVWFSLRMIGNLGTKNDVTFDLGMSLLDIPRYIEELASLDSTGGFEIIRYPGNNGRKYFTSKLRIDDEKVKFDFNAKGFGFLGKGLNYYGPISGITLIRYLVKLRRVRWAA